MTPSMTERLNEVSEILTHRGIQHTYTPGDYILYMGNFLVGYMDDKEQYMVANHYFGYSFRAFFMCADDVVLFMLQMRDSELGAF